MAEDWIQRLSIKSRDNVPIATQLAEQLKWLIAAEIIKTEEWLPSVRKLSKQLEINLHTVRAAYNKLESIGLVETIQSQGTRVNQYNPITHSGKFAENSGNTIGILVPDLSNPFYTEFLLGVDRIARKEKIITTTYNMQGPTIINSSDRTSLIYKNMLLAKGVEGLIIGPFDFSDEDSPSNVEAYFNKLPVPIVYVDRPEISEHVVNLDSINSGRCATNHLIEHGHQNIGLISGKTAVPTLNNCFHGYVEAMETANLPINTKHILEVEGFSYAIGYNACKKFILENPTITAIFIAGDMLAIGALRALHEMKLVVPQDIAIIGYNNIQQTAYTIPTLTTVATPTEQLGEQSMQMLLDMLSGKELKERNITLSTQLIIRESCGCTA